MLCSIINIKQYTFLTDYLVPKKKYQKKNNGVMIESITGEYKLLMLIKSQALRCHFYLKADQITTVQCNWV